ncbi:WD40-like Beta Propeller Repeat [Ekhidna lutea]|uniref:WD40-like Beta Propeller Repeat n=1 Tax=Ekhidna lutea TaxID=447679 RepID=A0A239EUQ0_EKHLU|nr:OmpA family protein [Ekhidna lutea]SNS48327.1 WD40-like Beta Propeller Repeat [Ekhidna lutea]
MKKIYFIIIGLLAFSIAKAQETVAWGTQVVDVSSEYSPYEFSAIQTLHRPNVLPNGGENPNAWRPKSQDKEEFIMVSFQTPIKAKQVAIAESENPGAVKAVYGYDSEYNEYTLFELTARDLPIESRLLNLFFEETPYAIEAVRVVLDCSVSEGYNAIDAIGISASNIPINVLLNLAPGVNSAVDAEKLSTNVNSDYVEHSPIISPDGKKLYFSRQFHPDNVGGVNDAEDIWVSELDEETGEWLPAKNVGPPLNTKGPNFISSMSMVDGKEVLILGNRYGKKGRMYTGVSMSTKEGDTFADPTSIEIENEYNYSPNADFFLAPGGEAMIMSAERDDTYGGRDLYVSFKKNDGTWTEPMNLGDDINTLGEDESPFMAEDGRTLYFSSDGYTGYGGVDIYVSFKLDDTWKRWSEPENLGPGINKEGNDEYFSIPTTGQNLYFTRGEKGEDTDIFSFKVEDLFVDQVSPLVSSVEHLVPEDIIATVSGTVLDAKTEQPVNGATVLIERLPDGLDIGHAATNETGTFRFTVQGGWQYGLVGEAEGYISETERLNFVNLKKSDTVEKFIRIFPIQKGETIELKNIFFDFDKAELKTASYPELNRVLDYLTRGTIDKIMISGHTDSKGDPNYNMGLSGRRAKAVMDFFIRNGISRDRLSYKAFGETKPKAPNDTPENRQKNRRVEFQIQ